MDDRTARWEVLLQPKHTGMRFDYDSEYNIFRTTLISLDVYIDPNLSTDPLIPSGVIIGAPYHPSVDAFLTSKNFIEFPNYSGTSKELVMCAPLRASLPAVQEMCEVLNNAQYKAFSPNTHVYTN